MNHTEPAWDIASEYPSFESAEFLADYEKVKIWLLELEALAKRIDPENAAASVSVSQEMTRLADIDLVPILFSMRTYASCSLSVDGADTVARRWLTTTETMINQYQAAMLAKNLFLTRASDDITQSFLNSPVTKADAFAISRLRLRRENLLSLPEEQAIKVLSNAGHIAWGNLYNNIASTTQCHVELPTGSESVGMAKAAALLQSPNEETRRAAFFGVARAWEDNEEICAAAFNALSGWRLEEAKLRSHTRTDHYLEPALHGNRMSGATLDTMMAVAWQEREVGQDALRLQAKARGKKQLDPWDQSAPPPRLSRDTDQYVYHNAMAGITEAAAGINSEMAEFVQLMNEKRWIEGRVLNTKQPGGYCTRFLKSHTPRVYMTYTPSPSGMRTLAHEIGHAFHGWKMRDMKLSEMTYPMTLAETASIFTETAVSDYMLSQCKSADDRFNILWGDVTSAALFLLKVPARYSFEREIYDRRAMGELSVREFKKIHADTKEKYLGDTIALTGHSFGWQNVKHYYMTKTSFYNFPYLFGYLFSLGVYAQREKLGKDFYPAYIALLRDTGRMTAEDLAMKHLGADLTKPDFWLASIGIVKKKIEQFKQCL